MCPFSWPGLGYAGQWNRQLERDHRGKVQEPSLLQSCRVARGRGASGCRCCLLRDPEAPGRRGACWAGRRHFLIIRCRYSGRHVSVDSASFLTFPAVCTSSYGAASFLSGSLCRPAVPELPDPWPLDSADALRASNNSTPEARAASTRSLSALRKPVPCWQRVSC